MNPTIHTRRPAHLFRFWLSMLAVLVLVGACGKTIHTALPPDSQVLALGDSLTAGAGVTSDEAWPHLLARRTDWEVVNGGVSGDTSSAALQRLPELLEQHKPALVLVMLGGNDMLRHIPATETVANLEQIIDLVRKRGADVVLLATPQPNVAAAVFRNLSAADFYQEVAKERQVPLIEDAVAEVLSDPELKGDPLHPNAAGHALLAGKIFKELQALGYARQ